MFDSSIFESVKRIQPSARGELEITDAIQNLIDRGLDVHPHIVRGWWKDTGKLEDMLEANRIVLEGLEMPDIANRREDGKGSRIEGRVKLRRGVGLVDSVVPGPAVVCAGALMEHGFVRLSPTIAGRFTLTARGTENL